MLLLWTKGKVVLTDMDYLVIDFAMRIIADCGDRHSGRLPGPFDGGFRATSAPKLRLKS